MRRLAAAFGAAVLAPGLMALVVVALIGIQLAGGGGLSP